MSLHASLSAETEQIVNSSRLEKMKSSAYLINTARGGLVNESDLAAALESGKISGAGLDVLSTEPPTADNPLIGAKNCIITPHIAWSLQETRQRLIHLLCENIRAFQAGQPINQVN